MRPSEARRRRSKKKISPVERTARTRARSKGECVLSHGPCREARGWGGRARSGDGKNQHRSTREAGERGSEGEGHARVRRQTFRRMQNRRGYGVREGERWSPRPHGSMCVRHMGTFEGGANEGADMVAGRGREVVRPTPTPVTGQCARRGGGKMRWVCLRFAPGSERQQPGRKAAGTSIS